MPFAVIGVLSVAPNASTLLRQHEHDYLVLYAGDSATYNSPFMPSHLIGDLGWTTERAAAMRQKLGAFIEDWEDPGMDVYDAL